MTDTPHAPVETTDAGVPELPDARTLAWKLALTAVVVVAVVGVLGVVVREPVTVLGTWFVEQFGLLGVFVGVFAMDILPVSIHDPVLVAGHTGGIPLIPLVATACSASLLATSFDYLVGMLVGGRSALLQRLVARYKMVPFMRKYGPSALALAAVMPFPFTIMAWAAGMSGVPFRWMLVAGALRGCKMLAMLGLIALGWHLGG